MERPEQGLIDLGNLPPERLLDFLVGEWDIFYPGAERAGFERFQWFTDGDVLEAFQEWTFAADPGAVPWRGRSYYQYVPAEERWHFNWAPGDNAGALWTGGLEGDEIVFYEYRFSGDARSLQLAPRTRYLMSNIARNQFPVVMYRTHDGGRTYPDCRDRLLYRRRHAGPRSD